jgi:alkylated DNA repair protein (DNA oxidative demethylase)
MSLFEDPSNIELSEEPVGPGATILRSFAISEETEILSGLSDVVSKAPFRHMITPGGFRMSVAMTNCGALGWVTDRTGYRYDPMDPESGLPWHQYRSLSSRWPGMRRRRQVSKNSYPTPV